MGDLKIHTSYFAKFKFVPNPVAISTGVPDWFEGESLKIVAPTWDLVMGFKQGIISESEYITNYINYLEKSVTPQRVIDLLSDIGDEVTLVCWEGRNKFCHRHTLAGWLINSGLIENITEYEF